MAEEEFEPAGLLLYTLRELVDLRAEIIVWDERHNGDEQTGRRGDEGLGNPPGDGRRLAKAGFRDNTKGTDHTRDGAEQAQQWRQGDDGIQDGEIHFHAPYLTLGRGFHGG